MNTPPGTVARLKELLTEVPADQLTDEQYEEITYLIGLHRHSDPWVRGTAKRLDLMKEGQEPLF